MKQKIKLIISVVTALMLSTAIIRSEANQGKVGLIKGSYVCAASTLYDTEEFSCFIYDDNTVGIRRYKGNSENVIIPSTINGYKVTKIESNTFNKTINKNSIREITIPSSVKSIGDKAFWGCNLNKVTFSEGLEKLGSQVFGQCSSLTTITLPDTIKEIGDASFSNCTALEEVVLSDSLVHLSDHLFSSCDSLENIVIPDSVTTIGEGVFQGCSNLSSVELSNSMTEVGEKMFYGCSNLQEITLPDSITRICDQGFYDCVALSNINLPDNLKIIGSSAFENCESISSIELPNSLEEIGSGAFSYTSINGEFTIPKSLTKIGSSAFSDTKINGKLVIPDNITTIGSKAFSNLDITELIIEGSPLIDDSAFSKCNMTNITIKGTPIIKSYVFSYCKNLENINVSISPEIKWGSGAFDDCINLQKLNDEEIIEFDENGFPGIKTTFEDFVTNNMEDLYQSPAGTGFWNKYTQNYVKKVVEREITPEMTDVEKAKALHDWICNKVEYDSDNISANKNHVDYSVFFYDSTVCEGYARAYTLLLQEAGFKEDEVYYVSGINHAWNIVKLGGEYYHIDVCHDDGADDYSHFMISDSSIKELCSSHVRWSVTKPSNLFNYNDRGVGTPKCNTDRIFEITTTSTATTTTSPNSTATTTPVTTVPLKVSLKGDANCDGKVTIADAAAIYQHLGNFDKYALSDQGAANADVDGKAGITAADAIAIQKFTAKNHY